MKKLAIIVSLLVLVCFAVTGCSKPQPAARKNITIVTSFYPMYIDVINITKDVDGVEVINMTKPQTGCLHDYQLTTEDMKTLEKADVLVANGAGMENKNHRSVKL